MMGFASFALFSLIVGIYVTSECFSVEIIGGREVQPHSRPFMASLQHHSKHFCGGVLIHPQSVLTAAHCCFRFANGHPPTVVLGAHSLSKNEPMKQMSEIQKFIPFSRFPSVSTPHDIMLIKLHGTANLNNDVQLLQLRSKNYIRDGTKCQVTGWGATNPDLLNTSDTLKKSLLPPVTRVVPWSAVVSSMPHSLEVINVVLPISLDSNPINQEIPELDHKQACPTAWILRLQIAFLPLSVICFFLP